MLRATAASRLYIGSSPVCQHGFDTDPVMLYGDMTWTEVRRLEALGSVAQEWTTTDLATLEGDGTPSILTIKVARRGAPMQIVMGIEDDDLGQRLLFEAYNDPEAYPFRLRFSDDPASPERRWLAIVTNFTEQFDTASSVMKRVAELTLTSSVLHV